MAKTAAERQADKRRRDAKHLEEVGAEALNMTIYKGTRAALDSLKLAGNFEQDEEVRRMPCRHTFHADCIASWIQVKHSCPLCVAPITLENTAGGGPGSPASRGAEEEEVAAAEPSPETTAPGQQREQPGSPRITTGPSGAASAAAGRAARQAARRNSARGGNGGGGGGGGGASRRAGVVRPPTQQARATQRPAP